ncbi:EF-P lysine aminoacylase EpmA [Rhizomicrobium electricum]|uniref:EF-P lysine aminoacylase EpmA n=1 Tax=Rhizomicrobium electricum TaxID=480070 RepID=UPI00141E0A21|nr:EF-P lysine aminoacylase EpmA [Rhizomicrobium electricum]
MAKTGSSWWAPHRHADRRPALTSRGQIKKAFRAHFEAEGFTEVECGALAVSPGNEAHLAGFATEIVGADGSRRTLYLHTSPEFAAKKLLAAGETRIFDFARVFRNREAGSPLHVPEFTMLEWYRAREPYAAVIADTVDLVRIAAKITGLATFSFRGRTCDALAEPECLTVGEAFQRYAGVDLLATLDAAGQGLRDALAEAARNAGHDVAANDTWADIFSKIIVTIEGKLGKGRPTVLCEYPRCEAALARAAAHDPRVSERFELYVCGVELANGFGELTDPVEQRARFEAEMAEKERVYGERYPLDEDFLDALAIMPEASGVALGFDRLVMLATGSRSVQDVLWTPAP